MGKNKFIGLSLIFMALMLVSCDKDENKNAGSCNVENPAEDLEWLKANIEEIEQNSDEYSKYAYYMSATYDGETVFYYGNCHPLGNYFSYLLNCNGDSIGNTKDNSKKLTDVKIIWKHKESLCNINE